MDNAGKFKVGTRFRGNVNGVEMEVVKIEQSSKSANSKNAIIQETKTGKRSIYGLRALEKCDVSILK